MKICILAAMNNYHIYREDSPVPPSSKQKLLMLITGLDSECLGLESVLNPYSFHGVLSLCLISTAPLGHSNPPGW